MIPNITKGTKMYGLVNYLMGEGRSNEHTNQHVISGSESVMFAHMDTNQTPASIGALVKTLNASHKLLEENKKRAHVWHCSLSVSERDGELSDEQWQNIAQDFMREMGFDDGVKAPFEWVAIRHGKSKNGNDHIHIAVNLVRLDGTRISTHGDYKKAQEAARKIEKDYGLEELNTNKSREGYKYAEQEKARRQGKQEPDRIALQRIVRTAATTAVNEADFVRKVRESGAIIRPRFEKGNTSKVVGYSVAMRPAKGEKAIWYGGGSLAKDLRITELRNRWEQTDQSRVHALDEWQAAAAGKPPVHGHSKTQAEHASFEDILNSLKNLQDSEHETTWEDVSSDFSGAFGSWAQQETDPEIARKYEHISDVYSSGAGHQTKPQRRYASRASSAYWFLLTSVQRDPSGRAARIALMRQMFTMSRALYDMYQAQNDLRRAAQLNAVVKNEFTQLLKHEQGTYTQVKEAARVNSLLSDPETLAAREAASRARGATATMTAPRPDYKQQSNNRTQSNEREF